MKLSDYLAKLHEIYELHGDINVKKYSSIGVNDGTPPEIRYMAILKPREYVPRFYNDWEKGREPGEKVVYV